MRNKPESLLQHSAFEFYLGLGPQRNYSKVARQFKVTPGVVSTWAKAFKWEDRVREREERIKRSLEKKTDKSLEQIAEAHIKILDELIEEYISNIDRKGIQNASELLKVMKLLQSTVGILQRSNLDDDNISSLSPEELMHRIEVVRGQRSQQDVKVIERFRGIESGSTSSVVSAREGVEPEVKDGAPNSIQASGYSPSVPQVHGGDQVPQWRRTRRKDNGGSGGDGVALYGEVSGLVPAGESPAASIPWADHWTGLQDVGKGSVGTETGGMVA